MIIERRSPAAKHWKCISATYDPESHTLQVRGWIPAAAGFWRFDEDDGRVFWEVRRDYCNMRRVVHLDREAQTGA